MANQRLRVLCIISDLSGGGAERVVATVLTHLDRSRFEPGLCMWRDCVNYSVPGDSPRWIIEKKGPGGALSTIRRLTKLIDDWKPDIVYSNLRFVNLVAGAAVILSRRKPAWFPCFHNSVDHDVPPYLSWLFPPLLRRAHRVIAVSEGVRKSCIKKFRMRPDRVVTIYNPIDFRRIDDSLKQSARTVEGPTVITSMGRLTPQKDYHTLLRAFFHVRKELDSRLIILGEGPLRESLEQLCMRLGIRDSVEFLGFVEEPYPVLANSDLFAMSSRYEGLLLGLIEAMACGIPCVSTNAPHGPSEVLEDGRCGLLVGVQDSKGLARAMLKLLRDRRLAANFVEIGQASIKKRFSVESQVRRLEELFLASPK
jgi:glycosyltransferase involved in cell wall biosynthesis